MMLRFFGCRMVVLLAFVLTAACTDVANQVSEQSLKADAGEDIIVSVDDTITLDASNSHPSQSASYELAAN